MSHLYHAVALGRLFSYTAAAESQPCCKCASSSMLQLIILLHEACRSFTPQLLWTQEHSAIAPKAWQLSMKPGPDKGIADAACCTCCSSKPCCMFTLDKLRSHSSACHRDIISTACQRGQVAVLHLLWAHNDVLYAAHPSMCPTGLHKEQAREASHACEAGQNGEGMCYQGLGQLWTPSDNSRAGYRCMLLF